MNKPTSSKLFNFKAYLTLPEAAEWLTNAYGENVAEADILRMALGREIKLSFFLINGTWAAPCNIGEEGSLILQDKEWVSIIGLLDVPMFQGNYFEVEKMLWNMTGKTSAKRPGCYKAFLEGDDGIIFQLKDSFNISEYQAGFREKLKEQRRQNAINNTSKENSELLLSMIEEERISGLKIQSQYQGSTLPKDGEFVIRSKVLDELKQRFTSIGLDDESFVLPNNKALLNATESNQALSLNELSESTPNPTARNVDTPPQQLRLNDLRAFMDHLTEIANTKNIDFDPLDLQLTKLQLFKELQDRYPRFKRIKIDQFERDWKAAKDDMICANQHAMSKKGEVFLRNVFG
ncbi:MAG: hypothetical protein Q8L79_05155 [Methylobacter sp.]|uniref:hypothetical protein n=1 Tax=Methylobacter sp. TaxID=2051955 RepID=UPI00272F4805|nr:hypothetical protein [Methylobacter sp.]MDP1664498.1 hypothetical protein [Methylobacter sp.]